MFLDLNGLGLKHFGRMEKSGGVKRLLNQIAILSAERAEPQQLFQSF